MDIGVKDKPHVKVLENASGLLVHEDTEMCTYTLYKIVETLMHPRPKVSDRYAQKPYTFDALTGVMRVYELVGVCETTDSALEKLMGQVETV